MDKNSLEKRVKEDIRNYSLGNLFNLDELEAFFGGISGLTGAKFLLTDKEQQKLLATGGFDSFDPEGGAGSKKKISVEHRTLGYLHIQTDDVEEGRRGQVEALVDSAMAILTRLGEETYLDSEYRSYISEESRRNKQGYEEGFNGKEDTLTGTLSRDYLYSRIKVLDRAEVIPVAVIEGNINDWKFVNDNFGDEESDRLIKLIAKMLKDEAKPEYLIGRVDGDAFVILIPMAEEGEAEDYCARVQDRCYSFNDFILAPSIAFGVVYKTNVEEKIEDKISDAEFEMFDNKFVMKNMPDYQERLRRGL